MPAAMIRWTLPLLFALALGSPAAAGAQTVVRDAPRDVKPGIIAVSTTPPVISVDGKPDRLSPGSRIRDTNNMLVLSGALAGQTVHTVYRRDGMGLVHEVWLLTPEEYKKVGGTNVGDPDGYKRFAELLNLVWAARALVLGR